ncbi:alpha-soluble NSF attachment protein 2 [Prunus yedoensis var. nudiflora]|uniref:Alpha-soluble NSF attachment protein 2 n=1 Tax=Prunus yedoensis var. nudiflora TaxID=2094558 RepID=A0A314XTQ9_PRUYE|nr:alpha-soluble NSF attachment protein 2 [Prunus yedoensis var. nudiflora]
MGTRMGLDAFLQNTKLPNYMNLNKTLRRLLSSLKGQLISSKMKEVTTSANQCKQKVAQFAAQIEQYPKSIEIYEEIARHSLNNNLLKRFCCNHQCIRAISGIRSYFFRNKEYRFLADIAASVDEEDVAKFTDVVKEFDSMTPLDSWKTTLLLRVKEKLKSKELEEDDLT